MIRSVTILLIVTFCSFSYKTYALNINKKLEICTEKTSADYVKRINNLNSIFEIDHNYQYPLKLKEVEIIKIRALDMIKSQSQVKGSKIFWMLEFRPLPEQTNLDVSHYPRVILACERSDISLVCETDGKYLSKLRVFKNFSFNLKYTAKSEITSKCKGGAVLNVKYNLDIDDEAFLALKAESFNQITGSSNNILAKVIDNLFDPKTLFETYIQHLYEQW